MTYFLGVDVSKLTLDIAVVKEGKLLHEEQILNNQKELNSFLKHLQKNLGIQFQEIVVCMEYTGIYNYKALEVLCRANINVCMEPAMQIKKSQGMVRGKDDKIDARRIAQYAYKNREELQFYRPDSKTAQKLKALLSSRERLINVKIQLEVPLQELIGYTDSDIVKALKVTNDPMIKYTQKQLNKIELQIDELIKEDQDIKKQYDYVTSVIGIGKITGLNMMVSTGFFRRITDYKKFACYSGVAPFKHESGTSIRGKMRVSKMANMNMKKLLHLAAMSAIRSNGELKEYYQRKVTEGKNKMAVINAVRNKLISRVFTCVNQQRLYQKIYQNTIV
jgi:transposase